MSGRTLVILLIVALFLGGVLYLTNQDDGAATTVDPVETAVASPTPQVQLVRDATVNDVQRLEITRLEDDFQVAFTRDETGAWFQVVPTQTMVISGTMDSNVTRILNMTSQAVLSANENPLEVYGLDNPQFEFVLVAQRDGNNLRHVFTIGNRTATGDRYYAQKQGDPRIHVILSSTVEAMTALLEERPFAPQPVAPVG